MPKLNYDARRDYENALEFFQKTFIDQDESEKIEKGKASSPSKRLNRSGVEDDEGSDPDEHVSQTSFFG
jgi:hypothetical protein